jgi:thioredoxin 1
MATLKVTDETFARDVLGSKLPVLVDFWAAWCGPCRMVAPILEELSDQFEGKLTIAKLDVDHNPDTAARFRIQSIPTLILFKDGAPAQSIQGAAPKQQLLALLAKWLPDLRGPLITVKELSDRLARNERIELLDLRRPADFDRSHLRGSRVVDPEKLDQELAEVSVPVVLICRTGELSLNKAAEQRKRGRDVIALEKGLLEWEGSGKPTYSTREEQELSRASG